MKRNILKSIFFFAIIFLGACTSDIRMPEVTKASLPKITLDPTSDVLIQGGVLNGRFIVDMYYKDYPADSKVVIAMNGNYSNLKVLTASLKTFPSVQTVNDSKLVSLFGLSSINAGDYFEVGLDVQNSDGSWYPAFNPKGVSYGSGPINLPGSSPIIKFKAVCSLNINDFVGVATLVDPYWYEGTYTANIEKVDETHLKIKNFAEFSGDLILTVNKVTHSIVVEKQIFGADLAVWGMPTYKNPSAVGTGEIDACSKKLSLILTYATDQAAFSKGPVKISF